MVSESYENFEYDEDIEAFDESDESDEGYESDEAYDEDMEAAGESDEALDESDEALDESDEAFAESDESSDESDQEAVSAAQVRADKARRRDQELKLAAQLRAEAQRASSVRQNIASRIRGIRSVGRTPVYNVGRLQGAGVVTAVLPNGRRTRMRLMPAPAPIGEVNKLRAVFNASEKRQAAALSANSKAISTLSAAQTAAVKQLTAQQVKSDRDLGKRIIEGDARLDKRITTEIAAHKSGLDKQRKRFMTALKRQRQRSIWNNILITSALPFFAAHGDRSNPFGRNNLILTASLAGTLLGDELIDQFTGRGKSGQTWGKGATVWSYAAPVVNGATAFFLLDDEQHERFVTGTAQVSAGETKEVQIKLPKDSKGQLAVATVIATDGTPSAPVKALIGSDGKLKLTAPASPAGVQNVAFIVDTNVQPLQT